MAWRRAPTKSGSATAARAPPPGADTRPDAQLSSAEYLERHQIAFYLRDVISLLLRAKDDRPLEFIADYFSEVLNGTHVLLRVHFTPLGPSQRSSTTTPPPIGKCGTSSAIFPCIPSSWTSISKLLSDDTS